MRIRKLLRSMDVHEVASTQAKRRVFDAVQTVARLKMA
jgi:hypothetical protein